MPSSQPKTDRRSFLQFLTMLGVGGQVLLQTRQLSAAETAAKESVDNAAWPGMTYRTLGRTGFRASRLVYGCGAALSRRPNDRLLNVAMQAGVNVYDVGYSDYYGDAEKNLAEFAKRHRDEIFLISKAPVDIDADEEVTTEVAKRAAANWTAYMDGSLKELDTDHVDAYYQMAANNPGIVRAEEMYRAFEDAKAAGKVTYLGLSTHENAQGCLEAATETGWYDLAMIAITPGWLVRLEQPQDPDRNRGHGAPSAGSETGPRCRNRPGGHEGRAPLGRTSLGWRFRRQDLRPLLRRVLSQGRPVGLPAQLRVRAGARLGRRQRRHPGLHRAEGEFRRGRDLGRSFSPEARHSQTRAIAMPLSPATAYNR